MHKHKRRRGASAPRTHGDVCVDADVYFGDAQSVREQRKVEQLRAAIRRALVSVLDCDIDDPVLAGLYVVDVIAEPGGAFAALFASDRPGDIAALQERLRDAAPLFRIALAHALTRKRVPTVTFYVVPAADREVGDD